MLEQIELLLGQTRATLTVKNHMRPHLRLRLKELPNKKYIISRETVSLRVPLSDTESGELVRPGFSVDARLTSGCSGHTSGCRAEIIRPVERTE